MDGHLVWGGMAPFVVADWTPNPEHSLARLRGLEGTMTDAELLDQIQEIRAKNNVCHVGIQRLALEVAPERARALLRQIVEYDRQIGRLSHELSLTPEQRHSLHHVGEFSA